MNKKFLSMLLVLMIVLLGSAALADLEHADGTVLRMATGYNSARTGLFFDDQTAGEGITLADGKTYHSGDLKPTWVELQNILHVTFENKYQGNSASAEFDYWKEQLGEVDMLSGTAAKLSEYGESGAIVNIAEYLDQMPNFKAYLDANPIVRLSITGNIDSGAIYFAPYFDGVNDGMYNTWHQGYGLSVDESELSQDARDAYEIGYLNGYNSEHLNDF